MQKRFIKKCSCKKMAKVDVQKVQMSYGWQVKVSVTCPECGRPYLETIGKGELVSDVPVKPKNKNYGSKRKHGVEGEPMEPYLREKNSSKPVYDDLDYPPRDDGPLDEGLVEIKKPTDDIYSTDPA